MVDKLEYRMYGLVPYNISPIQQGIQFGHAVQEYNNMIFEKYDMDMLPMDFDTWRTEDKTFMILNGGTTNGYTGSKNYGTLNQHRDNISEMGVEFAVFCEPDLGDQLTAVVFLLDERVWNYEKYPTPAQLLSQIYANKPHGALVNIREETAEAYAERLGGEQNVKLREFLSQFRLA
jgi:hypothetical protein